MSAPPHVARSILLAALLCSGTASLPLGCTSYDEVAKATAAASPNPMQCGACHSEVTKEWRRSAHARAWTGEAFAETTHEYALQECLGCHAPGSLYEAFDLPEVRAERRAQGVDCQACHLDQGALVGPIADTGALTAPHPVRVDEALYRSAELCGRCHQGTYSEWETYTTKGAALDAEKKTCQECHMPEVVRTITQRGDVLAGVFPSLEDAVPQRRHTFDLSVVAELNDAVAMDVTAKQAEEGVHVEVTITNLLPHLIPTGDFGFRKARLLVVGRGPDGGEVSRAEHAFFKELGTALVPREQRTVSALVSSAATSVEVALERMGQDEDEVLLVAGRREPMSALLAAGEGRD